jgi:hypothetical protein
MCASAVFTECSTDATTTGGTMEVKMAGWPMGKGESLRAILFSDVAESYNQ